MIHILLGITTLGIAFLGAMTDLRSGKVRNLHLLTGLVFGIILACLSTVMGLFSFESQWGWTINLGLSCALAFFFYCTDVWAPGDAKLFLTLVILYPFNLYPAPDDNIFPALDIVVFSFALGYIWLIVASRGRDRNQAKRQRRFLPRTIFPILLNIGFATGIQSAIYLVIPSFYQSNRVLCLLGIIGIAYALRHWARRLHILVGMIGLVSFFVEGIIALDWASAMFTLLEGIFIAWLVEELNARAASNSYRSIPGEELRAGMILSFGTIVAMNRCIDPALPRVTTENRRSRINLQQAEAVQRWCKNTGLPVTIVEMIPFAPFIAASVFLMLLRYTIFYR